MGQLSYSSPKKVLAFAIVPKAKDGGAQSRMLQAATIGDDGHPVALYLPAAGVKASRNSPGNDVCIIVRTYVGHSVGQYNLRQMLNSLHKLHFTDWHAFVVPTDNTSFPELASIVGSLHDSRMEVSQYRFPDTCIMYVTAQSFSFTVQEVAGMLAACKTSASN